MKIEEILAPWERGLGAPFVLEQWVRTELEWAGEKCSAVVAVVSWQQRKQMVLRLEGDEAAWWLFDRSRMGQSFMPRPEILERYAQIAVQGGRLCRLIEWCNPRHDMIFSSHIGLDGRVLLQSTPTQNNFLREPFGGEPWFALEVSIFHFSLHHLRLLLALRALTLDEEWVFTQRFRFLNRNESNALLFGLEGPEEFEQRSEHLKLLMQQAMAGESWVDEDDCWSLYGAVEDGKPITLSSHESPRLEFWANVFMCCAPLAMKIEVAKRPCVLRCLEQFELAFCYFKAMSAHEILEAKMHLLDWARENLPPEKYAQALKIEGMT